MAAATCDANTSGLGNDEMVTSLITTIKHRKVMEVSQFEGRMKSFVWIY